MDANDSKTQTPNLVEKVAKLEKQNAQLLRRLDKLERDHKALDTALRQLRSHIQVAAQRGR